MRHDSFVYKFNSGGESALEQGDELVIKLLKFISIEKDIQPWLGLHFS